jgi:Zn-finger nucleic acid-binding protein
MDHCPDCGLILAPATVAGHGVAGCEACGGAWVATSLLSLLAREHPAGLAELDRRFDPTGASGGGEGHCPHCGAALAEHRFPAARDLPLASCAACRGVWLRHGQGSALAARLAPPATQPVAAEEPEITAADQVIGVWRTGRWAPRLEGQPFVSWFTSGMPLWFALALVLAASPLTDLRLVLLWPGLTLGLQAALSVVWSLLDTGPELNFVQTYALLLRVVAVVIVASLLIFFGLYYIAWWLAEVAVGLFLLLVLLGLAGTEAADIFQTLSAPAYYYGM